MWLDNLKNFFFIWTREKKQKKKEIDNPFHIYFYLEIKHHTIYVSAAKICILSIASK